MKFSPCIIIPVYRHVKLLAEQMKRLKEFDVPLIVVDDGNCAEDAHLLASFEDRPRVHIISSGSNQGKGGAVLLGSEYAKEKGFTHALQIDADGQHCIDDIPKFLKAAQANQNSLILGRPIFDKSAPKVRVWGRELTTIMIALETLSFKVRDGLFGFRVYPIKELINIDERVSLRKRMGFDVEIIVRLAREGIEVVNIGTPVSYHQEGFSNFRYFEDNVAMVSLHIALLRESLFRVFRRSFHFLSKEHFSFWFEKRERGSKSGLRLLLLLYRYGGRALLNILLYPVIFYFFIRDSLARKASREYLIRVGKFSKNPNIRPSFISVYRHFFRFGEKILNSLEAWLGQYKGSDIVWYGEEIVTDLLAKKQGAVILSAHFGCLEVCRATHRDKQGLKVTALMYLKSAEKFIGFLRDINPESGVDVIGIENIHPGVGIEVSKRIEAGEFVAILADRLGAGALERSIEVDFLGDKALLPEGPFALSVVLDCPVLTFFSSYSEEKKCYEAYWDYLHIPPPQGEFSSRDGRKKRIEELAIEYAKRLEARCIDNPYQWFNFYDFWKIEK